MSTTTDPICPPRLYSLRALSESGYGSVPTLHRAIREGRLEAVRVGGRIKISADALNAYLRLSAARYSRDGDDRND